MVLVETMVLTTTIVLRILIQISRTQHFIE